MLGTIDNAGIKVQTLHTCLIPAGYASKATQAKNSSTDQHLKLQNRPAILLVSTPRPYPLPQELNAFTTTIVTKPCISNKGVHINTSPHPLQPLYCTTFRKLRTPLTKKIKNIHFVQPTALQSSGREGIQRLFRQYVRLQEEKSQPAGTVTNGYKAAGAVTKRLHSENSR